MKNGACYIRVSTDKQEELSPDAQKRLLLNYAQEHQILLHTDSIYMDIGISGRKSENRPAFRNMIAAAKSKEHPYDVLLVWKFSRFARNQEESIVYKSLLKKAGVEVISVSEPLPDGIMGGLIERILEWMDEYYSIRLSGEVMRGMTEKALRGGYMSSAPFGYDYVDANTRTINPGQAAVVKRIFEMYVYENASKSAIAKYLNKTGISTRRGRKWESKSVAYILENPFYTGQTRWNYTSHASGSAKNDASQWILAPGKHEALISPELFEAAAQKSSSTPSQAHIHGRMPAKHWLSGFLRCARCGGPMNYRSGRDNQSPFFFCKNHTLGTCIFSQRFTVPRMEAAVLDGLMQALHAENLTFTKTFHPKSTVLNPSAYLEERLKDLKQKEKRIHAAYLEGIDTLEDYRSYKKLLDAERKDLEEKLAAAKPAEKAITLDKHEPITNVQNVLALLQDQSLPLESKSDALRSICEKITFDKETEQLKFYFTLP